MLKKETKFLEELNSPEKKIGLRATAYFTSKDKSVLSKDLKSQLTISLGENFLKDLEQNLKDKMLSPNNLLVKMEFSPLPEKMHREIFPFFKPRILFKNPRHPRRYFILSNSKRRMGIKSRIKNIKYTRILKYQGKRTFRKLQRTTNKRTNTNLIR